MCRLRAEIKLDDIGQAAGQSLARRSDSVIRKGNKSNGKDAIKEEKLFAKVYWNMRLWSNGL